MNENTIKRRRLIKGAAWSMPVIVGSMSTANAQIAEPPGYSAEIPAYAASICNNNMKLIETTNLPTFASYQDAYSSDFFSGLPTLQQIQDDITAGKIYFDNTVMHAPYGVWRSGEYQVSFDRTFLVDNGNTSSVTQTTITLDASDTDPDRILEFNYQIVDPVTVYHVITTPGWTLDPNTADKDYNYSGDANKQLITLKTTATLYVTKNTANNTYSVVIPTLDFAYGLAVTTHGVLCSPGKTPFNDIGDFHLTTDISLASAPSSW